MLDTKEKSLDIREKLVGDGAIDSFVLGSIGPLGRPLAPMGAILPEEAKG